MSLELKEALKILSQEKKSRKKSSSKKALKEWTQDKETIQVLQGYSPYIRYKNKNYSLDKDIDIKKLSLKAVLEVIEKKDSSKGKKAKAYPKSKGKTRAKTASKSRDKTGAKEQPQK